MRPGSPSWGRPRRAGEAPSGRGAAALQPREARAGVAAAKPLLRDDAPGLGQNPFVECPVLSELNLLVVFWVFFFVLLTHF